MHHRPSVVVTALGAVTPIGIGLDAYWDGLVSGRSGAASITRFDTSNHPARFACEIPDFVPSNELTGDEIARTDRFTQFALAAAAEACREWNGDLPAPPERIGVLIGSGGGGVHSAERANEAILTTGPGDVDPLTIPMMFLHAASAEVATRFGLRGPNYQLASACATGGHAIGDATRMIQAGMADVMLVGGAEAAITPTWLAGYGRMGVLSRRNEDPTRASRPFDAGRDGFVVGEGSGILVLERRDVAERRGAPILAEVAGYGASADAFDLVQPDPLGAERAIQAALDDAQVAPEDVDYINAHGTSTPYNDRAETQAIKAAFGPAAAEVAISSTKSQIGHLLGAAGAVEAVAIVLTMQRGIIPATINLEEPDPECDLDYVPEGPREKTVNVALSNSFGFGGLNACVLLKAA